MRAVVRGAPLAATPQLDHLSRRSRLAIWWAVARAGEPVECRPACPNDTDELLSCPECRAADLEDRAAW